LRYEDRRQSRGNYSRPFHEHPFETAPGPLAISMSLGVAGTEDWQDANPEQLIEETDGAPVLAKPRGLQEIQIASLAEDKVPALINGMTRCAVT
jgi:hypothetical protein